MKSQGTAAALLALVAALCLNTLGAQAQPDTGEVTKDDLRTEVRKLREAIADLKKTQELRDSVAKLEYETLSRRLAAVERSLRDLPSYGEPRRAAYDGTAAQPAAGTIRLDNRLGVRADVTINGVLYSVPPLTVQMLRNRPAGSFTYEVTADGYGITAPKRTTLGTNETWTLTIY